MPDARLQRTRECQPTVPACVRLGHFEYFDVVNRLWVCRRCGLRRDPVLAMIQAAGLRELERLTQINLSPFVHEGYDPEAA